MFLLSGYALFLACVVSVCTLPETNGLDLNETDRKWRLILEGRQSEYQGDANDAKFLSLYERQSMARQSTIVASVN
jgi:hypothetical protein